MHAYIMYMLLLIVNIFVILFIVSRNGTLVSSGTEMFHSSEQTGIAAGMALISMTLSLFVEAQRFLFGYKAGFEPQLWYDYYSVTNHRTTSVFAHLSTRSRV